MPLDRLLTTERVPLGRTLVEGARITGRHVAGLLVVTAAIATPIEIVTGYWMRGLPYPPRTGAPTGADFLFGIVRFEPVYGDVLVLLLAVPVVAGVCAVLVAGHETGARLTTLGALGGVVRRLFHLVSATILIVAAMAGALGIAVLLDRLIPQYLPRGSVDDLVGVTVLGVLLALILPFAFALLPAAVIEPGGPLTALARGLRTAAESLAVALGRSVVAFAVASVLSTAARLVVVTVIGGGGTVPTAIAEAVADVVFLPIFFVAAALTYVDVRARGGDVDADWLRHRVTVLAPHTG